MDVSKNMCHEERKIFFEMKKGHKVSCVKKMSWSIVVKESINILIFYIFEYGAEYGTECSAESSTKQHFILIPYLRKQAFRRSSIK